VIISARHSSHPCSPGGPGCVYDTQCDCPPPPPQPAAQDLTGLTVSSYDAQGAGVTSFVQPEIGSLEGKPTEVVFAYEQEGVTPRVIYAVVPTP